MVMIQWCIYHTHIVIFAFSPLFFIYDCPEAKQV